MNLFDITTNMGNAAELIALESELLNSLNKKHRNAVDKMVISNHNTAQEGWYICDFDN